MLQQTRVETVRPYFARFMAEFPTPLDMAEATEDQVLSMWSGLGYYRRARLLHAGARAAAAQPIPRDRAGLLALPGIGRYTAGAIASIAFGEAVGLVDGNVARVFARLFVIEEDIKRAGMRRAEALAERLVHRGDPGAWNQALMELGATVCTPRSPDCAACPIAGACRARTEGRTLELPRTEPKTKPRRQAMQALVARRGGKVLLARRRADGLFGGLWEPPMIEGDGTTTSELFARFPLASVERRGTVVHVLSHRRLEIDVHAGALSERPRGISLPPAYEDFDLFDEAKLGDKATKVGLATLAHKVFAASQASGREHARRSAGLPPGRARRAGKAPAKQRRS
jgi:A/G-specific adenine glycosylase